jgi:transcriptional regulator GlxA family with amidase domain
MGLTGSDPTGFNVTQLSRVTGPIRNNASGVLTIGIAVFDGFSLLQAAEVINVFDKANQIVATGQHGEACYRTVFVSRAGGRVASSSRIDVLTQAAPDAGVARALFVTGSDVQDAALRDPQLTPWLRAASAAVDTVCAIGTGEALLAAACIEPRPDRARDCGEARSHASCQSVGDAVPGISTGEAIRHALDVVYQDFGARVIQRVIAQLPGAGLRNLAAFEADNTTSARQKIRDSAQWIARNCHKSISVTVAAQTAGMSERSFLRHFRAEMGIKPSEHLRRARVEMAAAMLEASDLPVDKIARRCGLTSGEGLARLFRQVVQVSPTEYRSRVRAASA